LRGVVECQRWPCGETRGAAMRAFQLVGWQKVELAASTAALRMAGIGAFETLAPPRENAC
jgi:hypothetical protein